MNSLSNFLNAISYKRAMLLALGFIAICGLVLSFQGFDVCDEGLALTVYQQVFNCPSCIEFNFYRWFAAVVGGAWYSLFPDGGIWSFRLLTVLSFLLSAFMVFKIFKGFLKPYQIAIAVVLSSFINDFGFIVFYHNHLTILLYLLLVYLLHQGILKNDNKKVMVAGFIMVFCVLSRLPNLTLLALTSVFFYPYVAESNTLDKKVIVFRYFTNFTLGLLIGVLSFVILAKLFNHEDALINSFFTVIGHGTAEDSNHNITRLIGVYFLGIKKILIVGLKFSLIAIAFLISFNRIKSKILNAVLVLVFAAVLIRYFKGEDIFEIYFFTILAATIFLIRKDIDISLKLLVVMALIVAMVLPLGSDGAMGNMGFASIWLVMPLFLGVLLNVKQEFSTSNYLMTKEFRLRIPKISFSVLLLLTIFSYASNKIYKISQEAYFDSGSRFLKTYKIHHPLTDNIYTTKERADVMNDFILNINNFIKPNDYLLAYDNIPMLHYMTETRPYMFTPWVWVYNGNMFESQLENAEKKIVELPIVVQQKFNTIGEFSKPDVFYMSEEKDESYLYNPKRTKAINDFLRRNKYDIVWSNDYFNIFKSKNRD